MLVRRDAPLAIGPAESLLPEDLSVPGHRDGDGGRLCLSQLPASRFANGIEGIGGKQESGLMAAFGMLEMAPRKKIPLGATRCSPPVDLSASSVTKPQSRSVGASETDVSQATTSSKAPATAAMACRGERS